MTMLRNITVAIGVTLTMTPVFATITTVQHNPSTLQVISNWKFMTQGDGMMFLLDPDSPDVLLIHVNKTIASGQIADPVTLHCNATDYRVEPDSTVTCTGNFDDVSYMQIAIQDFKNGSEGTYVYKPVA